MSIRARAAYCAVFVCLLCPMTWAGAPMLMNYQGLLTDGAGTPQVGGPFSVSISIYDDAFATNPALWNEIQLVTTDDNGRFSALLGSVTPLTDTVFTGLTRWLGTTVSPDVSDLLPRTQIVTVAYAFRVVTVNGATGGDISSKVSIGPGHTNTGAEGFVAGTTNALTGDEAAIGGGSLNEASGQNAVVGGGAGNVASGDGATVSGGAGNKARGRFSVVGGGGGKTGLAKDELVADADSNVASGNFSTVSGGRQNKAEGSSTTVGGGWGNTASAGQSSVGGGIFNSASNFYASVGGGSGNQAASEGSTVAGGSGNTAIGFMSSVTGGYLNYAWGSRSFIGGGAYNRAYGLGSVVAGGGGVAGLSGTAADSNVADGDYSFIGGGLQNYTPGSHSLSIGGKSNTASGNYSSVSGGLNNSSTADWAVNGGGDANQVSGLAATVAGGSHNTASADLTSIAGGNFNRASGYLSSIGGGLFNLASAYSATISGGRHDTASGDYSAIGGGLHNVASQYASVVGGGTENIASAEGATVPGGVGNVAGGKFSFAAGNNAQASHNGSFVWADDTSGPFATSAPRQFLIRASGGVGIGTDSPGAALEVRTSGVTQPVVRFGDSNGFGKLIAGSDYISIGTGGGSETFVVRLSDGNVGIGGGFNPSNVLTVVAGSATDPIADAWTVYSSRRWKKNIKTISEPLELVTRLRGVSYDWKSSGTHDIGLIAEEVGYVLPEVVAYEENGTDAKSVDYARLVAVLIEGMKEQQRQIDELKSRLDRQSP